MTELRRGVLAVSVLNDVDIEPAALGVTLPGTPPIWVPWAECRRALAGHDPETTGRRRLTDWLQARRWAADLTPEQLRERLRPVGLPVEHVLHPGLDWVRVRVLGDALDLGLGAVELDPAAAKLDEGPRFPLCHPEALERLFKDAGLSGVEVRAIDVSTHFENFDDYWQPFLGGQGPAANYVATLAEGRPADDVSMHLTSWLTLVNDNGQSFPDAELMAQHSPLMSPLVWDLAHIGNYEELWLLRELLVPWREEMVSAGLAGLSGALFGGLRGSVGPNDFVVLASLLLLLTLRIGGVNTVTGALFGAFTVAIFPIVQEHVPQLPAMAYLLTGLAAVSVGRDPNGVGGQVSQIGERLRQAYPGGRGPRPQSPAG